MWTKKTNDINLEIFELEMFEFQANKNFLLKQDKTNNSVWYLCNSYNKETKLLSNNKDLEVVKSEAFNFIITRFFEDIIKTTTTTSKLLEVLDQTITNSLTLGKTDVVIGSGEKRQPFALDTLSAVLKQSCLGLILETKIKNHLTEE